MKTWHTLNSIEKRIHGFFSYLLYAFFSLINPEFADKAMFAVLSEQFKNHKVLK